MFKTPEVLLQIKYKYRKKDYVLVVLGFFPRLGDGSKFYKNKQTCYMTFHFIRVKSVNSLWSSEDIIKVCRCCGFF